jgi:hypothetical protein
MDVQKLIYRFFPSLTDFAFLSPLVLLFSLMDGTKALLPDGDTGWHIRTGDWILGNGRVPTTDLFSFTKVGQPWFAWEWLWDVVFAWLHRYGGMAAVLLASIFVIGLTFALLFRVVRSQCGNDFIAFATTLLAVAGSSLHFVARPHVFTLLFIVILYWILERARSAGPRLLLAVPVLMVLWVNVHAGFVAGILIVGAYACGDLTTFLAAPPGEETRPALRRFGWYSVTAAACVLAALANPYGYRLLAHIYSFVTNAFLLKHVVEYQAVDFRTPAGRCFEVMLLLGAIAAFVRVRRREFAYAFLFVVWAHLALTSQRHVPIFMIVMAPSVALALHEMVNAVRSAPVAGWMQRAAVSFDRSAGEFAANDRIERFHLISVAALVLLFLVIRLAGAPAKFRAEYDRKTYPEAALAAFTQLGPSARVFTDDVWGGYLTYRLYPAVRVFVDGRIDFFGSQHGQAVLDALAGKDTWQQTFQRYGVNAALIPADVPLVAILKQSKRWEPVYGDGTVAIFRLRAEN